ncbi:hypothetical protein [Motiliproteus sp. SC1-56]|uniref:hypothetical protein n=1 Tax=Motiliproteus sp. SC1-56 TaxID=2799565 RepID=UPI001A9095BA|nr:hypothetical protein [Motiliproteus sp. SC1-56]
MSMNELLRWVGDGAALLGIGTCLLAGLARLGGAYYGVGGVELATLFSLGVGLMVLACLAKLHLLLRLARQ